MLKLGELTLSHFLPYQGSAFSCSMESGTDLVLVLTSATSLAGRYSGAVPEREPFSLVFTGPRDIGLPQSIHPLRHPELGVLDIFLVPIGLDAVGRRYEAIFS